MSWRPVAYTTHWIRRDQPRYMDIPRRSPRQYPGWPWRPANRGPCCRGSCSVCNPCNSRRQTWVPCLRPGRVCSIPCRRYTVCPPGRETDFRPRAEPLFSRDDQRQCQDHSDWSPQLRYAIYHQPPGCRVLTRSGRSLCSSIVESYPRIARCRDNRHRMIAPCYRATSHCRRRSSVRIPICKVVRWNWQETLLLPLKKGLRDRIRLIRCYGRYTMNFMRPWRILF